MMRLHVRSCDAGSSQSSRRANRIVLTVLAIAFAVVAACDLSHQARAQTDRTDEHYAEYDRGGTSELEKESARTPPPETASRTERCAFYLERGTAYAALGRYTAAISDLTHANQLGEGALKVKDPRCNRWRILSSTNAAYRDSGDALGQIAFLKRTINELGMNRPFDVFYLRTKLTFPILLLGRVDEAKAELDAARKEIPRLQRDPSWQHLQDDVMSTIHQAEGEIQLTEGNFRVAEQLARQAVDENLRFVARVSALPSSTSLELRAATAAKISVTRLLAQTLVANNRLGEAAIFARITLTNAMSISGPNTVAVAKGLNAIGMIRLRQGRIEQANALFTRALETIANAQVHPSSIFVAGYRARIGLTLAMQSRWSEAASAFEQRDAKLRLNADQFSIFGSRHLEWALSLIMTGMSDRAQTMLSRMIEVQQKSPAVTPLKLAYMHGYLAVAFSEQGQHVQAAEQFAIAVPELLRSVSSGEGAVSEGAYVHEFRVRVIFESYLALLAGFQAEGRTVAGRDAADEAFIIADVARNSGVQRAVAASVARAKLPDGRLADLARGEQDEENRIQSLSRVLESLGAVRPDQVSEATVSNVQRALAEANARHAQMRSELARLFPAYQNLTMPVPVSASDVRVVLREGEAVVSVYAATRVAYVWVITQRGINFRAVKVSREELAKQVASVRKSVDLTSGRLRRFDVSGAKLLYDTLLREDEIQWASARVLDVLPSAPLGELPFGLLLTDQVAPFSTGSRTRYAAMPWLIKKVAIAQFPSANALVTLRVAGESTSERLPFIGFGAPLFSAPDVSRLGQTRGVEASPTSAAEESGFDEATPVSSVRELTKPAPTTDAAQNSSPDSSAGPESIAAPQFGSMSAMSAAAFQASIFARLPALPDTGIELTEIARITGAQSDRDLFLGARATVENVKRADLTRYRVVAFATHGIAAGEVAGLDQPALALSNPKLVGGSDSGLLQLDDVLTLKLDADWVVLSACNTAGGSGIGAETISGLGRGFFYAGSRSLLVSNWAVETVSARLLTTSVFKYRSTHPNTTRAEALRSAALEVMNTLGGAYGHPAFWAAFSLVGDGAH